MKHRSVIFQICTMLLLFLSVPCQGRADNQFISVQDGSASLAQRIALLRSQSKNYPLLQNATLNKIAEGHCADMVRRLYFSNVDPDGRDTRARAMEAGYSLLPLEDHRVNGDNRLSSNLGLITEGISGLVVNFPLPVSDAVDAIWSDLLRQELSFIDSNLLEFGVSFGVAQFSLNGSQFYVYLVSVVIARPSIRNPYVFQCGHVVRRVMANNLFSPLEFVLQPVDSVPLLNADDGSVLATTDTNGTYCFRAPRFSSIRYEVCDRSYLKIYPVDDTLLFTVDIQSDCAK